MTEERMIRITDEEYKIWQRFVRDFDDELKEYDVPRQLWAYFESKNLEPAPPKDWVEKIKDIELRNVRLSRFILDWLGRELNILQEGDLSISVKDLLPAVRIDGQL